MSITKILTDKLSAAFAECGYSAELGTVVTSDRPDLCQFQCNGAFAGAKLYHKAPRMIAADAAAKLEGDADLEKVEVVGAGFINITVSDEFLLGYVKQALADENLGIPQAEKPETVVLDYGGPNVAKPLHIGHLRSAVIGEALKRLVRATGRKTISDVHLGDWGLQMGLVMAELQERHPEWACFAEDFDAENFAGVDLDAESLNVIYPFASAKSKENDDFKQKARAVTAKLQKGDPGYTALWREIIRISVADMKKNYENLNVDFDYWYGESDAEKYVPELLDVLNEKGLLHESQGAMVVDVAEESDKITIPPVIIKKSDNSNIYATTDLATLIQREHDFKPDQIWYIVDARQGLHFTQVFRCAKKAGIVPEEVTLAHIGYGTMNGADGKPYKTGYRKFKMQTVLGTDDYASLAETVSRRAAAYERVHELAAHGQASEDYFGEKPDLLLMDGGKGQVSAAKAALAGTKLADVPLFGMVKDDHHRTRAIVDSEGREIAINMNRGTFTFITAIQDETHRFANAYRKQQMKKKSYSSTLTEVPGVGPKTAKALMNQFKSVAAVREASTAALENTPGVGPLLAQTIYEYFHT